MNRTLIFFCLLLFGTCLQAQTDLFSELPSSAKVGGALSWQNGHTRGYAWDSATANWDTTFQSFWQYSNGILRPTGELRQEWSNGFRNSERSTSTYTQNERLKTYFRESWDGYQWIPHWRTTNDYDAFGNLTKEIREDWAWSWDTTSYEQYLLSYDTANRVVREELLSKNSSNGMWDTVKAVVTTYGTGPGYRSKLELTKNGAFWDSVSIAYNIVWEDFSKGQMKSVNFDRWENGQRKLHSKREYTFGLNGSYEAYWFEYDLATASFESFLRIIENYDSFGYSTDLRAYKKNPQSGLWVLYAGYLFSNIYDSNNNLIEYHSQHFDTLNGYTNRWRAEFLDYLLDKPEAVLTNQQVAWVSHPVGQEANLLVKVDQPGMLVLELTNVEGKKIKSFTTPHQGGKQIHHFNLDLTPGLYLFQVHLNGAGTTGKLLVR